MSGKTATILGSTGLVGSHLVQVLQDDPAFDTIRLLVRRPVENTHQKQEVKLVNFDDRESVKLAIDGSDAVFCTVGTTKKKVKGDERAYRKVDYDIPVQAAQFCVETGCPSFLLVSSVGANSKASNFYLKLKGEVEDAIEKLAIESISFFRPSVLIGERTESRPAEKFGQAFMRFFDFMMVGRLERYRPVTAELIASAMVQTAIDEIPGCKVYEFEDIRMAAKEYDSR